MRIKRCLSVVGAVFLIFSCFRLFSPVIVSAGTQAFTLPTELKPTPVNFINGSFQTPKAKTTEPYYTGFNMASVPGWNTVPVDPANYSSPYAHTIELLRVVPKGFSGFATTQANGDQYAELNAVLPGRLYQNAATVPGSRLYWQFAHRARASGNNSSGTGKDVMNFYLRPAGTPKAAPTKAQLQKTASDNAKNWYYYRGVYNVPAGQKNTEFAFQSVSSATGSLAEGNFLDDIKFQTGSSLIAKKSISTLAKDNSFAYKGEIVTVTVTVTNWGETDASRCVFRDVLSDGINYVSGSAKINGAAAGNKATFNNKTDELRVNFGAGATAGTAVTNGGVLKGSDSMGTSATTHQGQAMTISFQAKVTGNAGYLVKNQANISYNDKNYETYNAKGFTCYSSVQDKTPTKGNETTYVNQFKIVNRSISGRVWVDMNGNGIINAGETKISGLTVGLYLNSDTTYKTPVKNKSGQSLVTKTDANGVYNFDEVPTGTYKAVITTPTGYKITVKTASTDNDAVASGNRAVVSGIGLNSALSATKVSDSVINMDFGFVPNPTVNKTAKAGSAGINNGTNASPVGVDANETIEYAINVNWNGAYGNLNGVNITDTIPAGLTLNKTNGSYTAGMTWSTDGSGRTTVKWTNRTLVKGQNVYKFKVTVDKPKTGVNITRYTNSATMTFGTTKMETNSTYHALKTYTVTLSKLVKGTLSDPNVNFKFTVNLSGVTGSLPYTGVSKATGVSAPSGGSIKNGDTITLKHGQGIVIKGVPSGADYSVSEARALGYTQGVAGGNAKGTVKANTVVQFVNTKKGTVPTGVFMNILPYGILVALAGCILIIFLIIRRSGEPPKGGHFFR